jgi:hypothetical protein
LEKLGGRKKISSAREKEKKWREKISFILKFLELYQNIDTAFWKSQVSRQARSTSFLLHQTPSNQEAGLPDWANFFPMINCLLWSVT